MAEPKRSSRVRPCLILVGQLLFVFLFDWNTTYEVNVAPLYMLTVAYAAWHFGWRIGSVVSLIAAAIWGFVDANSGNRYSREWILWQQIGVRLLIYFSIALAVAIYRQTLEAHRKRLAVLERVLRVCPSCGRIGPREGGWMTAKEFVLSVGEQSRMCPKCEATHSKNVLTDTSRS